jgi:hypothetical protein
MRRRLLSQAGRCGAQITARFIRPYNVKIALPRQGRYLVSLRWLREIYRSARISRNTLRFAFYVACMHADWHMDDRSLRDLHFCHPFNICVKQSNAGMARLPVRQTRDGVRPPQMRLMSTMSNLASTYATDQCADYPSSNSMRCSRREAPLHPTVKLVGGGRCYCDVSI